MAIIPIRANSKIIGTLQLNDSKRDIFTKDIIEHEERLAAMLEFEDEMDRDLPENK